MTVLHVLALLLLCGRLTIVHSLPAASAPRLLLISFDGFRWDYPDLYHLPNFNAILKRGVRVKYIENSFATVTFPSHFTMVTGLFEEAHGIVANTMYDPKMNAVATLSTMNDTRWWSVCPFASIGCVSIPRTTLSRSQNPYSQPIWISNQLANDSTERRSGVIAWPGSNTPINGHLPSQSDDFDADRPFDSVLKRAFDWLLQPDGQEKNFVAAYHHEPDMTGRLSSTHRQRPASPSPASI